MHGQRNLNIGVLHGDIFDCRFLHDAKQPRIDASRLDGQAGDFRAALGISIKGSLEPLGVRSNGCPSVGREVKGDVRLAA